MSAGYWWAFAAGICFTLAACSLILAFICVPRTNRNPSDAHPAWIGLADNLERARLERTFEQSPYVDQRANVMREVAHMPQTHVCDGTHEHATGIEAVRHIARDYYGEKKRP